MQGQGPWARIDDFLERRRLKPDLSRALRATAGFMLPVLVARVHSLPFDPIFAAIAAQNIAMVDVRGSYALRLGLLLAMTAIYGAAGWLGEWGGAGIGPALLAIAAVSLATGAWRHLVPDYGPALTVSTVFMTLLALSAPGAGQPGGHFLAGVAGGLWGVLIQVALWPFHAEHPLRRTVSDSWLALSDWFEALGRAAESGRDPTAISRLEAQLRTTLDQTTATLAAPGGRAGPLRRQLEALNVSAARLFTRGVALRAALESLPGGRADTGALAGTLGPVFTSLVNTTRSLAITVVSRQPAHLATAEVRLVRLGHLLRATEERLVRAAGESPGLHQVAGLLAQLAELAPEAGAALRATINRAEERGAFSLELLDLRAHALKPLAAAVNLRWPPDAALVRFTLRLALLQVLGVAVMHWSGLPRGYWLPLTVLMVLQPDFGATRLRAVQRVFGTLAGSLLGSALLWIHPPPAVMLGALAATMAGFVFWLKRWYTTAVFFITLFVVLITEQHERITIAFTVERLAITVAGGLLAIAASYLFWPVWERGRLPHILASALRANQDYLRRIGQALANGGRFADDLIQAKRTVEAANAATFASLQRLSAEPRHQRAGVEAVAALANGNQRLTTALTGLAVQLDGEAVQHAALERFSAAAAEALEMLASACETDRVDAGRLAELRGRLDGIVLPGNWTGPSRAGAAAVFQYARCATELEAMLLEADALADAPAPDAKAG